MTREGPTERVSLREDLKEVRQIFRHLEERPCIEEGLTDMVYPTYIAYCSYSVNMC